MNERTNYGPTDTIPVLTHDPKTLCVVSALTIPHTDPINMSDRKIDYSFASEIFKEREPRISDQWSTPDSLFNLLDKEFNFNVDLAASKENTKCGAFVTDITEYERHIRRFKQPFSGFLNPPYSNPHPFILTALRLAEKGMTVVCLLKVDTSTKWWSLFWDYELHQPIKNVEIRFLRKRVKFNPPTKWTGLISTPAFPSCVVIMRP